MLKLLKESGHIGGKSSAGYGNISFECDLSASKKYEDFVQEHKDEIKNFIATMESVLN